MAHARQGEKGASVTPPQTSETKWKIASSHPGSAVSRSLIDPTQPKFGHSKLTNNWKNSRREKKKARKKKNLVSLFYYLFLVSVSAMHVYAKCFFISFSARRAFY